MGKVYDISSKLNLNIRPTLMFGEYVLDVNADAESTMQIMNLSKMFEQGELTDMDMTMKALEVLFGADVVPELRKNLLLTDLGVLAKIGMNLATGKEPYEGLADESEESEGDSFRSAEPIL